MGLIFPFGKWCEPVAAVVIPRLLLLLLRWVRLAVVSLVAVVPVVGWVGVGRHDRRAFGFSEINERHWSLWLSEINEIFWDPQYVPLHLKETA
jgi:hypothetical protein